MPEKYLGDSGIMSRRPTAISALQHSESVIKEQRKYYHENIGNSGPQYGHGLSQKLSPGAVLEYRLRMRDVPSEGFKNVFDAAYRTPPIPITIRQTMSITILALASSGSSKPRW